MMNIKNLRVLSLLVLILFISHGCIQNNKISTPYGVGFKVEDLNSITDKEIEYYIIDGAFIYMFKKDDDIATYIVPVKNVKLITPLKK